MGEKKHLRLVGGTSFEELKGLREIYRWLVSERGLFNILHGVIRGDESSKRALNDAISRCGEKEFRMGMDRLVKIAVDVAKKSSSDKAVS